MKQIVSILSAVFIAIATTGSMVTVHMCHDTITEISLTNNHAHCCDENKEPCHLVCVAPENEHKCCSNKTFFIKFDKNLYVPVQFDATFTPIVFDISSETTLTVFSKTLCSNFLHYHYRGPPNKDLYSLFCSFIFYG
ncbi:MAG: hypothetical protein GX277_06805 [Bacteroidales bacterium]|nr:hypothetical protein [Bacteroidales bacterium]